MWGSREGSACSQGLSRVACLVVQLLLFSHLAPQGSDNIWKLPGGPLMVARVSPLPSTLWDRGLACRGSCPLVVLGLVPRGPAAKEGMIRSCLHSVHTPAPMPWALGLSVPEAALTCSLRLALPSWRGLSPCGWSQNVMNCCALAMFLLSVGVCPAWSHVGATVGPPPHIDQAWFSWVHILSSTWCRVGLGLASIRSVCGDVSPGETLPMHQIHSPILK